MDQPILAGEEDFLDLKENLERQHSRRSNLLLTGGYLIGALAAAACAVALHHWVKH